MSQRTLQVRFKEALGRPPGQVIRDMQIERAEKLLRETDWPLFKVTFAVGFRTQSHFNNAFRRRTGMTPTEYRRRAASSARA